MVDEMEASLALGSWRKLCAYQGIRSLSSGGDRSPLPYLCRKTVHRVNHKYHFLLPRA